MATNMQKLLKAATHTGKLSSKVAFIRALMNEGREIETTISDETIGATLGKMPGNIADDTYQQEVFAVLAAIENPSPALKEAAGLTVISAARDDSKQYALAVTVGEAWDAGIVDEMAEDIEADKQRKEAAFHTLAGLSRLFGEDANSNEFKNLITRFPIVDSEDNKDSPFVPRFEGDLPAKYRIKNVSTGKWEPRDWYNVAFDHTPLGVQISNEVDQLDLLIGDKAGAPTADKWRKEWGTNKPSWIDRRKDLVNSRNAGRAMFKEALRVYQQLERVNSLQHVVAKILFVDGKLNRPNPIFIRDTEKAEDNQRINVRTFLSYDVAKAKASGGEHLADLVKTKPVKAGKGAGKGQGKVAVDPKIPLTPSVAQGYMAMLAHYFDQAANISAENKACRDDKAHMISLCALHVATRPIYNQFKAAYDAAILAGDDISPADKMKDALPKAG